MLPNSKKKWDTYKYNHKLQQLSKVFYNIKKDVNDNKLPDIIGLCEIENKLVLDIILYYRILLHSVTYVTLFETNKRDLSEG